MTPKEVLALIREKEVRAVDLRFMDFPGLWQHFTIPAETLDENTFEEGLGFDGSSIRGWQAINESDMLVVPVPETSTPSRLTVLKSVSVNVTEYAPGRRSTMRYWPVPSDTAERVFSVRAGLATSTVTPGRIAPDESLTTPVIDA